MRNARAKHKKLLGPAKLVGAAGILLPRSVLIRGLWRTNPREKLSQQHQIVTKRVLVLSVCSAATTPIYPRCRSPDITPLGTVAVLAKVPMP